MAASSTLKLALVLSAVDKATAPLRAVSASMQKVTDAGAKLTEASQKFHDARENIEDFTERAKSALTSILAPAADVDAAFARLTVATAASAGHTAESLAAVRTAAIEWSTTHTQSAADFIAATQTMIQSGLSQADAIQATNAALRLATATGGEAAATATNLATVFKQVGDPTRDASSQIAALSDVLARAQQSFVGFDVSTLADPLKDAAPAAKAAKVSTEQLVAVLGQLSVAGIRGGESGAVFANVLNSLPAAADKLGFAVARTADGGTDLVATLAAIQAKFGDVQHMTPETAAAMQEAFGPDGFKGLSAILGQTGALQDSLGKLQTSAGAAAQAQATLENTTAAQAQIAQQQLDALKLSIAAGILPVIQAIMPTVTAAVQSFTGFAAAHPTLVAIAGAVLALVVVVGTVAGTVVSAVGAFAGFAGTLLTVGGSVLSAAASIGASLIPVLGSAIASAWAFTAALLANPITWIVLAIIAAVALIYVYWEPISGFFLKLWGGIKDGFVNAWNALKAIWGAVVGFFTGIFGEVRDAFRTSFVGGIMKVLELLNPGTWVVRAFVAVWPWLSSLGARALAALANLPTQLGTFMLGVFRRLGELALEGLRAIVELHAQLGGWIVGALTGLGDMLMQFWSGLGAALWSVISSIGQTLWSGIQADVQRVIDWLRSIDLSVVGSNIVQTITAGIRAAANAPYEAMLAIVQKVRNLLPFSPAKEGPFRDLDKVKIVETVADSVSPRPLVEAMTGATAAAMAAIAQMPPGPAFASMPAAVARSAASNRNAAPGEPTLGSVTVQVIVQPKGDSPDDVVDAIDRYFRDPTNEPVIAAGLQRVLAMQARRAIR